MFLWGSQPSNIRKPHATTKRARTRTRAHTHTCLELGWDKIQDEEIGKQQIVEGTDLRLFLKHQYVQQLIYLGSLGHV